MQLRKGRSWCLYRCIYSCCCCCCCVVGTTVRGMASSIDRLLTLLCCCCCGGGGGLCQSSERTNRAWCGSRPIAPLSSAARLRYSGSVFSASSIVLPGASAISAKLTVWVPNIACRAAAVWEHSVNQCSVSSTLSVRQRWHLSGKLSSTRCL